MAIDVRIAATDELTPAALSAAAALESVAARERSVNALAEEMGVTHKHTAKALSLVEREAKNLARAEAKAQSNARMLSNNTADIVGDVARLPEPLKKTLRFMDGLGPSAVLVGFGVAAIGVAIAAAAAGTVSLGIAMTKAAGEAGKARNESRAMMASLTKGRGDKALSLVGNLATKLGVSIQEARDQFVKFRKAGLDNSTSANLIKLRADLLATGLSAADADEEIAKVLQAKGAKAQSRALKEISEHYGGIGSGALSAAKATSTAGGALTRISNVKTKALEDFWDKISPAIDEAASAMADFVEFLVKTPEFKGAMSSMGSAIVGTSEIARDFFNFLRNNWSTAVAAVEVAAAGFRLAFAPVILIFRNLIDAFSLVGRGVSALGGSLDIGVADVRDFVVSISDLLFGFRDRAASFGKDLVAGLISGLKESIPRALSAVGDFAGSVAGSFADALGISSPSTLFAGFGQDTVAGFEAGQRDEARSLEQPLAREVASFEPPAFISPASERAVGAEPPAVLRRPAPDESPRSSGAGISVENINIEVGNGDPDDIARSIRRELQKLATAMQISRGRFA